MSSPLAPPRVVGRYAVFDAIASGGMASVHLGRLLGPAGFSRTVAIKRLHENFASDPEFVAMFLDEARIVARIRHPNVVPTMDVVALEQELLLVMEYVPGETLALLLQRARQQAKAPPLRVAVDVAIGVLHGLHAAHEATDERGGPLEIVHRDISPHNILVGTDGVARVLDFGIAKAAGRMQHTRAGQVKGKLRYMAPEQLYGDDIDRTADIYAASIVLWEALTGERYIAGDSEGVILRRVLEAWPEPPSRLRPEIPPALDAALLRGLQRDPKDRYPTAQDMARALEAAVEPVPRSAVSAWVTENAGRELQRRHARVAEVESDATPHPDALETYRGPSTGGYLARSGEHGWTSAGSRAARLGSKLVSFARRRRVALLAGALSALLACGAWLSLRSPAPTRIQPARLAAPAPAPAAAKPLIVPPLSISPSTPAPPQASSRRSAATKALAAKPRRRRAPARSLDRLYRRD